MTAVGPSVPERPQPKRPALWLAALLNLLLAPLGYAYVGAWRWAWVFQGLVLAIGTGLTIWSLSNPPGVFQLFEPNAEFSPVYYVGWLVAATAAVHAALLSRRAAPTSPLWARLGFGLLLWVAPVLLALIVRTLAPMATYSVSSSSMVPTLTEGDLLLSDASRVLCDAPTPEPGDIVFYRRKGVTFVHRVVAGPGHAVAMRAGRLLIDGKAVPTKVVGQTTSPYGDPGAVLEETLPNGRSYRVADLGPSEFDEAGPVTLSAGQWFVLGDNRDNAIDSRFNGPIDQSDLCGKAVRVLKSVTPGLAGRKP